MNNQFEQRKNLINRIIRDQFTNQMVNPNDVCEPQDNFAILKENYDKHTRFLLDDLIVKIAKYFAMGILQTTMKMEIEYVKWCLTLYQEGNQVKLETKEEQIDFFYFVLHNKIENIK